MELEFILFSFEWIAIDNFRLSVIIDTSFYIEGSWIRFEVLLICDGRVGHLKAYALNFQPGYPSCQKAIFTFYHF